jgi:hypothetical protein
VLSAQPAAAQSFAWDALQKSGQNTNGTVRSADEKTSFATLRVEGTGQLRSIPVLTIDAPRITSA